MGWDNHVDQSQFYPDEDHERITKGPPPMMTNEQEALKLAYKILLRGDVASPKELAIIRAAIRDNEVVWCPQRTDPDGVPY